MTKHMGFLSALFEKHGDLELIQRMINYGAVIIDVRSQREFESGHAINSINIPLQDIQNQSKKIKEFDKPIVLCCATGNRSGQAAKYLKSLGIDCENGGSWSTVHSLINKIK